MTPSAPRIGLWLEPGFPAPALAAMAEVFAGAGAQLDAAPAPQALSAGGGLVRSASGLAVQTAAWDPAQPWQLLVVLAQEPPADSEPPCDLLCDLLREAARSGIAVGGLGAGAAWLAAAGLLDGQRACADWGLLDALAQRFPAVAWSHGAWELSADGLRLSAAAPAANELACAWLARQHGERFAQGLAQDLNLPPLRARDERQRAGFSEQRGAGSPKLAEALALMEANLAEPLPTEEIARLVGVSRRQLERLFKQHLNILPSRHYLELRLARAQRLLQQSAQSILQIGLSCGFASGSHFSNAYKAFHGHTPRDERSRRAQAWRPPSSPGDPA